MILIHRLVPKVPLKKNGFLERELCKMQEVRNNPFGPLEGGMRDVCVRPQLSRVHVARRGSSHMAQAAVPVGGHADRARCPPDAGRPTWRARRAAVATIKLALLPPHHLTPISQSVAWQAARGLFQPRYSRLQRERPHLCKDGVGGAGRGHRADEVIALRTF